MTLAREDWDFSSLDKSEIRAALKWEILRECPDVPEIVAKAKLWLSGQLSTQKPPLPQGKRRAWKGRIPDLARQR